MAWAIISYNYMHQDFFTSITGIKYDLKVEIDRLVYKGGARTMGEEEIKKIDFIEAFENIISANIDINTNTIAIEAA